MKYWLAVVSISLLGLSASRGADGQEQTTSATSPSLISGRTYILEGYPMYVNGKPFSLVDKRTVITTLPDGTDRTDESVDHVFRDSQGRFRIEGGAIKDGKFVPRSVTIFDPVNLTSIRYLAHAKTGQLTHVAPRSLPTPEEEQRAAEQRERSQAYDRKHPDEGGREELGRQTVAGEITGGVKTLQTYRAGNGRPEKRIVTETWTSPDLRIPLLVKSEGSVTGSRTIIEATELQRGEPDPALFKAPEGLELVE